ncbi:hypothetical protein C8F04DRAFT_1150423 [Mycena alexandri]|uniref:BTB domain-containing protein n=1 Tax=Mycena alexandri TaxID=1745969 RepID=A0AAD6S0J2_9AGAR|nr:hypothetical protein C8F04DRAFT_1150423 [Mycena alexandri]
MDIDPTPNTATRDSQDKRLNLTRSQGLWRKKTIFRVSRDMLAIQSPVFRDMLSLPAPKDIDTVDDCPFVLLPDPAKDVASFLRALFYYDFFEPSPAPTTFEILAGVLRMSHKYEVDGLRKRALTHLSSAHSTEFGDDGSTLHHDLPSWRTALADGTNDENMLIVELARQVGADWILPTAFYRMCEHSYEETIITRTALSTGDKVRCFQGLRFLETTGAASVLQFLCNHEVAMCPQPYECLVARTIKHQSVSERRDYSRETETTMPFELWGEGDWDDLEVCDPCLSQMQKVHREARKRLWDQLPGIFGLPDWSELEKIKAEVLK